MNEIIFDDVLKAILGLKNYIDECIVKIRNHQSLLDRNQTKLFYYISEFYIFVHNNIFKVEPDMVLVRNYFPILKNIYIDLNSLMENLTSHNIELEFPKLNLFSTNSLYAIEEWIENQPLNLDKNI